MYHRAYQEELMHKESVTLHEQNTDSCMDMQKQMNG